MQRRVVVTGIGIWSCIGTNKEEVVKSLYAGKSGIGIEPLRSAIGFRSPLCGMVPQPQLKGLLDRKLRVYLPEEGEYAYMAAAEAFADATIDAEWLQTNEVGILMGNDSSAKAVIEFYENFQKKKDTTLVGSSGIFQSMNSTVSMNLSTIFKLKGVNMSISAACASGSHAIGLGTMYIRNGMQDVILCGGCQEANHQAMASFDGLSAFSIRVDEPTKASRPFDKNRDGLVPSGGAAALVLEEYEHAKARGAHIYGEIVGYGVSSNGGNISQPSADGCRRAMERALREAQLQPTDMDYINAHATSTSVGDAAEAEALAAMFAELRTPISSTKSMTGHECWMSGASEIIYTLLMMQNGFIAPNINFETPDSYSAPLNIVATTLEQPLRVCLSNSFGFGGTNSTLVVKSL